MQKSEAMAKLKEELVAQSTGEQLVASGKSLIKTQTEYTTAIQVQRPRDLQQVKKRVLEECDLNPEGYMYSWTVKNKDGTSGKIEGASVKLAMTIARNYGNCVVDASIVDETATHWTLKAYFIDLETGFNCTRLFKQRHDMGSRGRFDADRLLDINFQIGQSKAIRNVVLNSVPQSLIELATEHVKKMEGKKAKGEGSNKLELSFKKFGVTMGMLELRAGKPLKDWDEENFADLRAVYTALKDKTTTVENEFGTGEIKETESSEPVIEREVGEEG